MSVTLHEDEKQMMRNALHAFNAGVLLGVANGAILADATITDLKADFTDLRTANPPTHQDEYDMIQRFTNNMQRGADTGLLNSTDIAAADTVAGIRTLFTNAVSGSTASEQGSIIS
jgi:hypothetical protein